MLRSSVSFTALVFLSPDSLKTFAVGENEFIRDARPPRGQALTSRPQVGNCDE